MHEDLNTKPPVKLVAYELLTAEQRAEADRQLHTLAEAITSGTSLEKRIYITLDDGTLAEVPIFPNLIRQAE